MLKIRKTIKTILLSLVLILFTAGCHVRLATKEDWITAAPGGNAVVTATAAADAEASASPSELPAPSETAAAATSESTPAPAPAATAAPVKPTSVPSADTATQPAQGKPAATAVPTAGTAGTTAPVSPAATPVPKQTFTVSIMGYVTGYDAASI